MFFQTHKKDNEFILEIDYDHDFKYNVIELPAVPRKVLWQLAWCLIKTIVRNKGVYG